MSSCKLTLIGFTNYYKDLFSELNLPEGIDKQTLIDSILLRGGEFEVLYSNPQFMQYAIGAWSRKHYKTFDKWYKASVLKYEPIENYDRKEEWIDESIGTGTSKSKSQVSAFNSNVMQDDSASDGTSDFNNKGKHTGHVHGNIGVTTSQQMLESEYQIAKWNLYEHITDLFLQEFIIPIY